MTGDILQTPACTSSSVKTCLPLQLTPGLLCILQLTSGDILHCPCPAP